MNVIRTATDLKPGDRKVCLAIGVFDGVHLGHQQIIRQTISDARQHEDIALVVTFDQHPNVIVAPDRVPPLIYSPPQKLRAIGSLGADALLMVHFDKPFSEQSGEAFARKLVNDLGRVQRICVGADFQFGHQRSGNVALLKTLGAELGFQVHGLAAVALDGQIVSSTLIREAVRAGHMDAASQMLGRSYALAGRVVAGDRLGRELGFPTANLDVSGLVLPPNGVYAVRVLSRRQTHRGLLNIGFRPTLTQARPQLRVEAHLLDFTGELYGEELEVSPLTKLRDERKFASFDELKAQIQRDLAAARAAF